MCNILNFLLATGSLEEAKVAPLMDITPDDEIASWPSPRIIHTHFYQELLPTDTLKSGRRIILTYRNPKDTAVSMFHHFRKGDAVIGKLKISWNCFFEAWMKGIGKLVWLWLWWDELAMFYKFCFISHCSCVAEVVNLWVSFFMYTFNFFLYFYLLACVLCRSVLACIRVVLLLKVYSIMFVLIYLFIDKTMLITNANSTIICLQNSSMF